MSRSEAQACDEVDILVQYGTDITSEGHLAKSDRVIGREKEIERVMQVLLKREKSNACLIGDPGVGKTSIVEALARRIAEGHSSVPTKLERKKIFSIDVARLVAAGDVEARLKDLVERVKLDRVVILFMDDLHTLEAAAYTTILKPALARGHLKQFICATTVEGYRKLQEQEYDAAAFECIQIAEATRDESVAILEASRQKYEFHHHVLYTRPALSHAVSLSAGCITHLRLPRKAINLMDEAGARAHMLGLTQVTAAHVAQVVSVPDLPRIHGALKRRLVGQDQAVAAVATSMALLGLENETKFKACLLLTGPMGVGKTEMARVIAEEMFGDSGEAMHRLDMSEYMEPQDAWRMIDQLTALVRRRPAGLILLDKIEKAEGKALNVVLQILDYGMLTDAKGRTASFRNTIIILTSSVVAVSEDLFMRVDQVAEFKPLEKEHVREILEIMLNRVSARVAERIKIQLEFSKDLKKMLIHEGYDQTYGVRELKWLVARVVQEALARKVFNGTLLTGNQRHIVLDIRSAGEDDNWNWK